MSKIGAELKKAREAQQKTRADVARKTGILIHHLSALEHGSFDTLPDDETVAGFVKVYAEYLGFQPDEPVADFWAEREGEPPPPKDEPIAVDEIAKAAEVAAPVDPAPAPAEEVTSTRPSKAGSGGIPWLWILAGGALVVVIVGFAMRGDAEPTAPAVASAQPAAEPTESSNVRTEPDLPAAQELPKVEPAAVVAAPAPPQEALPEPTAAIPASNLRVDEYGVGTGVKDLQLVGESDRFRLGTQVWFRTRVEDGRAGDEIRHVWIREGREISSVELAVGSANWRTHSAKTLFDGSVGRWTVEARDAAGRLLARSEFDCEP